MGRILSFLLDAFDSLSLSYILQVIGTTWGIIGASSKMFMFS